MPEHLIEAAIHHCWKQEKHAHAEFYWHMRASQRAEFGTHTTRPWRGIMAPDILAIIHILEEMGVYDSPCEIPVGA